jgi:hypothetical protein
MALRGEAAREAGPTLAEADRDDPGSGLELVQRLAKNWGVRRQADGSRVVWFVLRRAD